MAFGLDGKLIKVVKYYWNRYCFPSLPLTSFNTTLLPILYYPFHLLYLCPPQHRQIQTLKKIAHVIDIERPITMKAHELTTVVIYAWWTSYLTRFSEETTKKLYSIKRNWTCLQMNNKWNVKPQEVNNNIRCYYRYLLNNIRI